MIKWALLKIVELKKAAWSKSENLVKPKKFLHINFSKLEYVLL